MGPCYYLGIMSGTSADGIDVALVDFNKSKPNLVATHFKAFTTSIKQSTESLFTPSSNEIDRMGELDMSLGKLYGEAAASLLDSANIDPSEVLAAGLHGQTIRHRPTNNQPFTLQIGNPYYLSQHVGITTVSDFRRADMTMGGQGAPLAPLFHHALFGADNKDRVIINIGGIANITNIASNGAVSGFDTGPGNGLMDTWTQLNLEMAYDENGKWAKSGQLLTERLAQWLDDDYYKQTPPKSTGKEYFTLDRLKLASSNTEKPEDIQNTLCELTAVSIVDAISNHCGDTEEIYICGGGAQNSALMDRIAALSNLPTTTTEALGVHPDWVEAVGFAWLAKQCLDGTPSHTTAITGATSPCILGAIHPKIDRSEI